MIEYFVKLNYSLLGYDNEKLPLALEVAKYVKSVTGEYELDTGIISKREVSHLMDVRNLIENTLLVHLLSMVSLVSSILILTKEGTSIKKIKKYFNIGLAITVGVILLAIAFVLSDFNLLFIKFHRIFFQDSTWTFAPSDTVIQLFPFDFWVNMTQIVLFSVVIETIAVFLIVNRIEAIKVKINKLTS